MPTLNAADRALHGLALTANTEVVISVEYAGGPIELVVTDPGTAPIYWTVDDTPPASTSRRARVIPAGVIATDSNIPQRSRATFPSGTVRVISAAAATISVQRG